MPADARGRSPRLPSRRLIRHVTLYNNCLASIRDVCIVLRQKALFLCVFYASLAHTTRTIYPLYVARKDQDATGYLKLSPVQATVMRVYTQIHAPGAQFAHVPSSCASITRPCTSVSRSTIIDTHVHARESCLIQREGEPRREHRFAAFSHAIHLVPPPPLPDRILENTGGPFAWFPPFLGIPFAHAQSRVARTRARAGDASETSRRQREKRRARGQR